MIDDDRGPIKSCQMVDRAAGISQKQKIALQVIEVVMIRDVLMLIFAFIRVSKSN